MRQPITTADIGHHVGYDPLDGLADDSPLVPGCDPVLVEFTKPHGWARVRGESGSTWVVFPENCFSMLPINDNT